MTSVISSLRRAREWAYPQLTKSAFLEKGVLTPDEFVIAGDELVYRCPTWSWECGDPTKAKPYLPINKQYLVTRNVPCQDRVSSMEQNLYMESEGGDDGVMGGDDDDDWLVSSIIRQGTTVGGNNNNNNNGDDDDDALDDDFDILDGDGEVVEKRKEQAAEELVNFSDTHSGDNTNATNNDDGGGEEEEEEYAEMADYEDENVFVDHAAAAVSETGTAFADSDKNTTTTNNNDALVKVRTYDVSITYDKYYQTPRVWMTGRDPYDQPLTAGEMMEDVISDYANKTVTMELHPHVSGTQASIHPCQHSKVMKAIVRNLIKATTTTTTTNKNNVLLDGDEAAQAAAAAQQQGPSVEMYLFIFLKFVSSMIPTINYDFTMDVTADTSK